MNKHSRRVFLQKLGSSAALAASSNFGSTAFAVTDNRPFAQSNKKLNVALCGLGRYAEVLAYGLQLSKYCRLAGLVSGHPEKAAAWQKKYGIPKANVYNYENFDRIASNKNIDVVYVVLPNALHKEFTVRAASAGKHVFCEKPMATSVSDCEAMIKACKEAGVQLAIGYRLHFEPYNLEIKRLGQQRVFGQVRYLEAGLGYKTYEPAIPEAGGPDLDDPANWRLNKAMAGGGPLMDLGIYCIQACRYTLGEEPLSVTAQYGPVHDKKRFAQVEECISWQMRFPAGALANCVTSCGFNVDRLFASTDEGYFQLSPGLSYGPFSGRTSKGEMHFPNINQQAAQLDAVGNVILRNQPLPAHITGEEGLKDLKVIEAIYHAADGGSMVPVS